VTVMNPRTGEAELRALVASRSGKVVLLN